MPDLNESYGVTHSKGLHLDQSPGNISSMWTAAFPVWYSMKIIFWQLNDPKKKNWWFKWSLDRSYEVRYSKNLSFYIGHLTIAKTWTAILSVWYLIKSTFWQINIPKKGTARNLWFKSNLEKSLKSLISIFM